MSNVLAKINIKTWGLTITTKTKHSLVKTPFFQNYTPLKFFEMSEDFFKSLNLSGMPELFWERSIIEKPNDGRDLVCHASAWDFFDGEDFR